MDANSVLPGACSPSVLDIHADPGPVWECEMYVSDAVLQDKHDDALVGIKSTALLFGQSSKAIMGGFAAGSIILLGCTGGALYFAWQVGWPVVKCTLALL